jgi:hypothetical protein
MTADRVPQMRLAREYFRRADGLWRRHKAHAVFLAAVATACAAWALVKQAAAWTLRHVRTAGGETDGR